MSEHADIANADALVDAGWVPRERPQSTGLSFKLDAEVQCFEPVESPGRRRPFGVESHMRRTRAGTRRWRRVGRAVRRRWVARRRSPSTAAGSRCLLENMSGPENAPLWDVAALSSSPRWAAVRERRRKSSTTFNEDGGSSTRARVGGPHCGCITRRRLRRLTSTVEHVPALDAMAPDDRVLFGAGGCPFESGRVGGGPAGPPEPLLCNASRRAVYHVFD